MATAVGRMVDGPGPADISGDVVEGERTFLNFIKAVGQARSHNRTVRAAGNRTLEKVFGTGYVTDRSAQVTKTVMGENSGVVGGYLVPVEFTSRILETIAEESFIYPRANVIPMNAAEILAPVVRAEYAQAAGTSSLFGGLLFTWGSSQAPSETEPIFGQVSLKAWDLLGYAVMSNQFLTDLSDDSEEYFVRLFGKAAAWYAEYAFLQGKGMDSSMPLGIINAPGTYAVTRATNNQISDGDIGNMSAAMLPGSWSRSIWACSPTAYGDLATNQSYSTNQGNLGPSAGTLLTRPLFVTDKLPALGTSGDLVFFDPFLYVIGDRQQVLIDVSEHTLFRTNQTVFRIWLRMDGKPQVSGTITLADGTTTVSPFVKLT